MTSLDISPKNKREIKDMGKKRGGWGFVDTSEETAGTRLGCADE